MSLGNSFSSPVRGGRRGGYTHCTTGLVLLSIFNIRMKKKGMVMDYGNEKLSYFLIMYHGMLLAVMEKRYKKIEKRRLEVSVGTTARTHEVG